MQCKVCRGSHARRLGRDYPPALVLPGAGDGSVCAQRQFPGLVRILDLRGCGVGTATPSRDVQAVAPGWIPDPQAGLPPGVEVDETWLSIGSAKRPVAVVLRPKGERLDLRQSDPGFDWDGWFMVLAKRGVQGVTTDDAPVYGSGLDRQPCAVHRQRTVRQHIRGWTGSFCRSCNGWPGNDRWRPGLSCWPCGRRWCRGGCA